MITDAVIRLATERFAAPIERTGAKATLYVRERDSGHGLVISIYAESGDLEASTTVTLRGAALLAFLADAEHHDVFTRHGHAEADRTRRA